MRKRLQDLLAMREALIAVRGPLGGFPKFRRAVEGLLKDPEKVARLMAELSADESAASPAPAAAEVAPGAGGEASEGGEAGGGEPGEEPPSDDEPKQS